MSNEEQERVAQEFEDCVIQRMTEQPQLSREQAEALCLPGTKPTDEPTPSGAFRGSGNMPVLGSVAIGQDSKSEIHAYWRRADRRQRIKRQIDTSHREELPVHERCCRALMEILHITRPQAGLGCTQIEKSRALLEREGLGQGDLGEDDILAGCIASVMSSQHVTEPVAHTICDRILYPEDYITYGKSPYGGDQTLAVLPTVIDEDSFVKAVETRMDTLSHETVHEASVQMATLFATDIQFTFAWKNHMRRKQAIDTCMYIRTKKRKETQQAAKAACEKAFLFTKFLDDSLTNKADGDIWEYIGEQVLVRSRLYGVSEKTARDWVTKELQRKGLLSASTPLPSMKEPVLGNLFLKTNAEIRRMSKESKKGLDGLYLTKPYGLKQDEDNDQLEQLEACIALHMEKEGWSREKAKEHCQKDLEHSGLPGT